MINLAGEALCDVTITRELVEAGIPIIWHPNPFKEEVPAALAGKLGEFTFIRAWYYWVVQGPVPLEVAEEMYNHPLGLEDIRVDGDAGNTPPCERAEWRNPVTHRQILNMSQKAELEEYGKSGSKTMKQISAKGLRDYDFAIDPSIVGEGFIMLYHIDSQIGLNLFVKTLREHNLV